VRAGPLGIRHAYEQRLLGSNVLVLSVVWF
jgi:hypothetical protein